MRKEGEVAGERSGRGEKRGKEERRKKERSEMKGETLKGGLVHGQCVCCT